ncbi:hypothetical protein [Pedobacter nyackensis]|uniref:hypothetical protein n=1 Tax=Pedobacter nyackensis TaxID=475255 RepID=UPI00292E4DB2|nr:hypothetical protein [Pedobacter nyackensis]
MNKIFLIILLCLTGCAVFKKTNKENTIATKSTTNQLESSQLVLKNVNKETQVFTYWNDSGFYQFQQIKEQIDQAQLTALKTEEKQEAKQRSTTKQTKPANTWVYLVVLLGLSGGCLIFWRLYKLR